MTDRTIQK